MELRVDNEGMFYFGKRGLVRSFEHSTSNDFTKKQLFF